MNLAGSVASKGDGAGVMSRLAAQNLAQIVGVRSGLLCCRAQTDQENVVTVSFEQNNVLLNSSIKGVFYHYQIMKIVEYVTEKEVPIAGPTFWTNASVIPWHSTY